MPFTATHIAAVVPIAAMDRRLPFTALAIGSMMPDVPLFFPWLTDYAVTHSALGVMTSCVPLGMLAFLLYESIVKIPLVCLLPEWIQRRLPCRGMPQLSASPGFWLRVVMCLTIGAYSHVFWDSFTHANRWGVELVPLLQRRYLLGTWSLPGYRIVQYGCSFILLPLLAGLAQVYLKRQPSQVNSLLLALSSRQKRQGAYVVGMLLVGAGLYALAVGGRFQVVVYEAVTCAGALAVGVAILYATIFHVSTRGRFLVALPAERPTS